MIYHAYQAQADAHEVFRLAARTVMGFLPRPAAAIAETHWLSHLGAAHDVIVWARLTHKRPPFGIATTMVGGREVAVQEEVVRRTPFASLLRFRKESEAVQPKVLVVAPLSGHFSTLLRDTVRTMLPEHDVHITDWHNARDVPLWQGRFDFDAFVAHLIGFLEVMGPGAHMVAICQPSVAALAATAIMAEAAHPAQPRSLTLMAGPIDTRVNPTKVNDFATSRSLAWFERNLIGTVPFGHAGALRRVYPGFLQLTAFMSMNIERHLKSFHDLYNNLVKGDLAKADATRKFYDEYFAVMDLPAEFYLQTIRAVFQEHDLPRGVLEWRGRRVDPRAIGRIYLLTVEGEKDDICSVGQTGAVHELCSNVPPYMRRHHVQIGVGHYGVFSGRRWTNEIYPMVRDVIYAAGG